MSDWKTRLREADSERGPGLRADEVRRMRLIVVAAAGNAPSRMSLAWPRAFVVAATVLVMLCASVLAALQRATQHVDVPPISDAAQPGAVDAESAEGNRQQLQFETPGGTRIIWVFDSQFDARGTLP